VVEEHEIEAAVKSNFKRSFDLHRGCRYHRGHFGSSAFIFPSAAFSRMAR